MAQKDPDYLYLHATHIQSLPAKNKINKTKLFGVTLEKLWVSNKLYKQMTLWFLLHSYMGLKT